MHPDRLSDEGLWQCRQMDSLECTSNFNGSKFFGTMEINSRYGYFEPVRGNHSSRSVGKWGNLGMTFQSSIE